MNKLAQRLFQAWFMLVKQGFVTIYTDNTEIQYE